MPYPKLDAGHLIDPGKPVRVLFLQGQAKGSASLAELFTNITRHEDSGASFRSRLDAKEGGNCILWCA